MATLLDWERALENTDGSEDLLIELAEMFIEECPEMMRAVRTAIDADDAPALQRAAHTLKGSVRIFAMAPAVEAARRLEEMGAAGDLSDADADWNALRLEIDRLTAALAEKTSRAME
ncbi:Hpt domain-containing protein [Phenylobacterium sp. LjRoot219]|uniref:Hpt domain-containing protein n=1 Tax=Phenylobacterium sp. LjRoot219 TaxID=3342283 RepID=UPI003ED0C4B0